MSLYLLNGSAISVNLQEGLPVGYTGYVLPGSMVLSSRSEDCELLIQELATKYYTLRYNVFRFFKKFTLSADGQPPGLRSRLMLREGSNFEWNGKEDFHLPEGAFTLFWSEATECRSSFGMNKEHRTLDIHFSTELAEELSAYFPGLAQVMAKKGALLPLKHSLWMTPAMRNIVWELLECPFNDATRPFFFDLKVKEFLFLMLQQVYHKEPARKLTPFERERISRAKSLLLDDLSGKPRPLRELARMVDLNEWKLKQGFKELFDEGIFECLERARMDRAKELVITTNLPIKEISRQSGYSRTTSFITAFRKRFGCTPGDLRRN